MEGGGFVGGVGGEAGFAEKRGAVAVGLEAQGSEGGVCVGSATHYTAQANLL